MSRDFISGFASDLKDMIRLKVSLGYAKDRGIHSDMQFVLRKIIFPIIDLPEFRIQILE